jgi:mono/diheme cytochrome c family protein
VLGLAAAARAQDADAARGEQLFATKQCVRCHRAGGEGPPLERLRRPQGAYELAGRMWNHAPAMFTVLKIEGLEWPRLDSREMADLMAYLQADPARDPPVDRRRGQLLLVGKGCLKCHALRGEGARLAPDLADRKERFGPAPAWAATMWTHTPRMAVIALEREILYPRFSGDEMRHLLGYLAGEGAGR